MIRVKVWYQSNVKPTFTLQFQYKRKKWGKNTKVISEICLPSMHTSNNYYISFVRLERNQTKHWRQAMIKQTPATISVHFDYNNAINLCHFILITIVFFFFFLKWISSHAIAETNPQFIVKINWAATFFKKISTLLDVHSWIPTPNNSLLITPIKIVNLI